MNIQTYKIYINIFWTGNNYKHVIDEKSCIESILYRYVCRERTKKKEKEKENLRN